MNDNDGLLPDAMARTEDEAGLWCARMQGENAADYRQDFELWRKTSPDHERAYAKALKEHGRSSIIASLPGYGPDRDRARELCLAKRAFSKPSFWGTKAALAASLALGAGLGVGLYFHQLRSERSDQETFKALVLVTKLGEIRTFKLPDGSDLTLDTQSRAEVMINGKKRRLRILSGRVRLHVAKATSPFEIDAGASRITASAGIFDLAMAANRAIALRPLTGQADLAAFSPVEGLFTSSRTISAGEAISLTPDRYEPVARPVSALASPDWPNGWVVCNGMTLSVLVELANAYSSRKIVIDAPATADIGVSGRIKIAETGKFVRNVAEQYDLHISENSHEIRLKGK